MEITVIVQARTSSTRLPNKIMREIVGKPLLELQMERIFNAKLPTNIVVATTADSSDDVIVEFCLRKHYNVFRGSMNDLLDRHYKTALLYNSDIVIKIPSDCPLIDAKIIDKVIGFYLDYSDKYDFVSNLHPASYPDGNDVEVMSINALARAWREAESKDDLEHTTPYIWRNPSKFRIGNVLWETGLDFSKSHRFTIDYEEDFKFIEAIYNELYFRNKMFSLYDILELLDEKPHINQINAKYHGHYWFFNNANNSKKNHIESNEDIQYSLI